MAYQVDGLHCGLWPWDGNNYNNRHRRLNVNGNYNGNNAALSSKNGQRHGPLKAETRIQIPIGAKDLCQSKSIYILMVKCLYGEMVW
jgi:hypothetical protein